MLCALTLPYWHTKRSTFGMAESNSSIEPRGKNLQYTVVVCCFRSAARMVVDRSRLDEHPVRSRPSESVPQLVMLTISTAQGVLAVQLRLLGLLDSAPLRRLLGIRWLSTLLACVAHAYILHVHITCMPAVVVLWCLGFLARILQAA